MDTKKIDLTSKIKKAAALKYEPEKDTAPRVIAAAEGKIAHKLLEMAKEHNIPICRNPVLADVLVRLDVGQEIPPELYKAAAEILAFIYSLEKENQ